MSRSVEIAETLRGIKVTKRLNVDGRVIYTISNRGKVTQPYMEADDVIRYLSNVISNLEDKQRSLMRISR